MSVEAPLSKHKRNNLLLYIVVLLAAALWLAYDGYVNQKFIEKHTVDGKPDSTLAFNQKAPPALVAGAVAFGVYLALIKNRKVVADEEKLVTHKTTIPYDSIEAVDKTHFESKGFFVIQYKEGGSEQSLQLTRGQYDNLQAILDKIVEKMT